MPRTRAGIRFPEVKKLNQTEFRQEYRFLLRAPGEGTFQVRHMTRAGDAENCARKIAKLAAKKLGAAEVVCVWKGPTSEEVPREIMKEIRRERVT